MGVSRRPTSEALQAQDQHCSQPWLPSPPALGGGTSLPGCTPPLRDLHFLKLPDTGTPPGPGDESASLAPTQTQPVARRIESISLPGPQGLPLALEMPVLLQRCAFP